MFQANFLGLFLLIGPTLVFTLILLPQQSLSYSQQTTQQVDGSARLDVDILKRLLNSPLDDDGNQKALDREAKLDQPLYSRRLDNNEQLMQSQMQANSKQVLAKKLHKLVDEIVEREVELANVNKKKPVTLNSDQRRKRKSWQQQQVASPSSISESNAETGSDDEKLVIIMKKPLSMDEHGGLFMGPSDNHLSAQSSGDEMSSNVHWPGQISQASNLREQNKNLNMNEHTRRILEDKFGIMKESKFSTNNHLGLKGVPKFGSDDEY